MDSQLNRSLEPKIFKFVIQTHPCKRITCKAVAKKCGLQNQIAVKRRTSSKNAK